MLYAILTLKSCFKDFTIKHKSIILLVHTETYLSFINLEVYKYNLGSDITLLAVSYFRICLSLNSFLYNAYTCIAYIDAATKIKAIGKKIIKKKS